MEEKRKPVFTGLIFITIGLLFLLNNLGYINGAIWRFWPVILIVWGIKKLLF